MIACKFFARGSCRKGQNCEFDHEASIPHHSAVSSDADALDIQNLAIDASSAGTATSGRVCRFHLSGTCRYGDCCRDEHLSLVIATSPADHLETSQETQLDTRSIIPCKFMGYPGGCQKMPCPYFHVGNHLDEGVKDDDGKDDEKLEQDEQDEQDEIEEFPVNLTRVILGATITYDEFGQVVDVTFPTDFSLARISNLPINTTAAIVRDILQQSGYAVDEGSIRVAAFVVSDAITATVKVKDPLFVESLAKDLHLNFPHLTANPMPIQTRQTNCRKVHVSWYKSTRTVWLNFGDQKAAQRVMRRFKDGNYKCLGRQVQPSEPKKANQHFRSHRHRSTNLVPWTLMLGNVPGAASEEDIEDAIRYAQDKPRHIEMGAPSHSATDPEISVVIRSKLEEYGPLESFSFIQSSKDKRGKVFAVFREEMDASMAISLDKTQLPILEKGRIIVSPVFACKLKIAKSIYWAVKEQLDELAHEWKKQYLKFRVYQNDSRPFTELKIEANNAEDCKKARKALDTILKPEILKRKGVSLWSPSFAGVGEARQMLKKIEQEFKVIIIRDKSKQELKYHGSSESMEQVIERIVEIIENEDRLFLDIDLGRSSLAWIMQGGFKEMESVVGKGQLILNVNSSKLTVSGSTAQHKMVLEMLEARVTTDTPVPTDSKAEQDCPICFCEAETPVYTPCKHTYCLDCFERYCESAGTASKDRFKIQCCGAAGTCTTSFTLQEIKTYISTSVFETVLDCSFQHYTKSRPQDFHCCPTPDCGYLYRCSQSTTNQAGKYTCPNCYEALCRSCLAQHGTYSCAEYKDMQSGGIEALERLKKELKIKDCPKCKTPMQKDGGCNHMTCGGCQAHICWVCMALFETSKPVYDHMTEQHGGIGLEEDLRRLLD